MRIHGGANPLDASAVHPESYGIVKAMAADLGCSVPDLLANAEMRRRIRPEAYVTETVGLPTLRDILAELEKPGRDPREAFEAFAFAEGVTRIEDLEAGMRLPGIVTNVTNFGAFVDIGVHQDGLVHISQLADSFVSDPHTVVTVQQQVSVTVLEVDAARKRISLSMRKNPEASPARGQGREQGRDQGRDQGRRPEVEKRQPANENRPRPRTENRQERAKPEQGHRPFQDMFAKFGKR